MKKDQKSDNTIVRECTCKSEYQDKRYGKGQRLMNPTMAESGGKQLFRCTVCAREHTR